MDKEQIIDRIVEREVLTVASQFVSDLMNSYEACEQLTGVDFDDLIELADVADYSEPPGGYEIHKASSEGEIEAGDSPAYYWTAPGLVVDEEDEIESSDDVFDTEDEAIHAAWEDSGDEPDRLEVFEYWIVSDWLARHLEEIGAPVAHDIMGFTIWGRTEMGQSLTMDSALNAVAARLCE